MTPNSNAAIAIDMGGTTLKIGIVHQGKIVTVHKQPASSHASLESILTELVPVITNLISQTSIVPYGIGIAFPGIVDSPNKRILSDYVKYPNAKDVDLTNWASTHWNIPLAIENDARAALVGEWQYGAGKSSNDLVLVTLGTGFGSAVIMDGRLVRGRNYLAGNLGGHMTINLDGSVCNCGNIGCLETESSGWALKGMVESSPVFPSSTLARQEEINFQTLFQQAKTGDSLANKLVHHSLKAWAVGIINLIHAYDPEKVIVGGGIMHNSEIIIPYVKHMEQKHSWSKNNNVSIVAAERIEFAALLGMDYLLTSYTH